MSSHASVLLLISLWASVHDGLGLPLTKEPTDDSDSVSSHGARTRRCACSSLLDSECHYFCHLDIIWVNTPSKTSVYGLGSGLSRRRRSAARCSCASPSDHSCFSFCQRRFEVPAQTKMSKKTVQDVLRLLQNVIKTSPSSQNASGGEDSGPDFQ